MIFTKYGRCILIDWDKPLECKVWGCTWRTDFNHDWSDVANIEKNENGKYDVYDTRGSSQYWKDVDMNGTIVARGIYIGKVRNKPGFDLKGLDEHLNTRQESEIIYDPIEHPSHYNEGRKYETIDVIEDWNLGYHLSNALKYLSRYNRKGDGIQDLKKAVWYIQRKIKLEEK